MGKLRTPSTRTRTDRRPAIKTCIAAALVLFALGGCVPRLQEIGPTVAPPTLNGKALIAGDGAHLPHRAWLPEPSGGTPPHAVLVALHGFNDYSNAFADLGPRLAARGIAVHAYDQRGFGATAEPGVWPGNGPLIADLAEMVAVVRARHPGLPLYVLGESMGGAVVMTALAQGRLGAIAGAVLVAPAVWGRETLGPLAQAGLWLVAHTLPAMRVTGRGLNIRPSDNIDMLRALGRDPLVIKRTRVDAVYGVVGLMDAALAAAPKIREPLLVLYGARDEIIPKEPTALMLARLDGTAARVAVYPDGYHMLTRDLQADIVLDDIAAWLTDRDAPLLSGYDRGWRDRLDLE